MLSGLGGSLLAPILPSIAQGQARTPLQLRASPGTVTLSDKPPSPIWSLDGTPDSVLRFKRGDELAVTLENDLPISVALKWHGIDGASAAEPLVGRPTLGPGGKDSFAVALRHAGTFICDARLLGDGQARPSLARALIVQEADSVAVDRDEVLLIEDWRLSADGRALSPATAATDANVIYTVNGRSSLDLTVRTNERLRLRFINACQRNVIALKIDDNDVLVMAIDGQPAEPFLARNGQLILGPGTRIDAFVDAARPAGSVSSIVLHDGAKPWPIARLIMSGDTPFRNAPLSPAGPLPSNGLPSQLGLKTALRIDLVLGAPDEPRAEWIAPANFSSANEPAFRVKRGRTVVVAVTNRATAPTTLHLQGHHFRLLDRLDDGWKPFWLDTLVIDAQQTQRIAFAAEFTGTWLMESMAATWSAPRRVRSYTVE